MEYIVYVAIAVYVFTDYRNYVERKNLYNRLMSRDFTEYVDGEKTLKKVKIPDKIKSGKTYEV